MSNITVSLERSVKMKGRFVSGLTTGIILGAAAGLMVLPQMDGKTRRKVCRTSKRLTHSMENLMHDLT
jgi:gas vesicle protein